MYIILYIQVYVSACIIPGKYLIVSILKIPVLLLPYWIDKLVFMEVVDLPQYCKLWTQGHKLTQVQNTTAEQHPANQQALLFISHIT